MKNCKKNPMKEKELHIMSAMYNMTMLLGFTIITDKR